MTVRVPVVRCELGWESVVAGHGEPPRAGWLLAKPTGHNAGFCIAVGFLGRRPLLIGAQAMRGGLDCGA